MKKSRSVACLSTMVLMAALVAGAPHSAVGAIRKPANAKFDYAPAGKFKIEIDGVIQGGFKEIHGLESEIEVIEYRDGDNAVTQKRPGRPKFKNIVLKRALQDDDCPISLWYKKIQSGLFERKSGSIIHVGRDGKELMRFNFFEAWPSRSKISSETDSRTGETHIVEEIEFVVERVERA